MLNLPKFLQKVLIFFLSSCMCGIMVPRNVMILRCTAWFRWHGFLGLVPVRTSSCPWNRTRLFWTSKKSAPHFFPFYHKPSCHPFNSCFCLCEVPSRPRSSWRREIPCKADWTHDFRMFRCVVRKLFDSLSTFVRLESMMDGGSDSDDYSIYDQETEQQSEMFFWIKLATQCHWTWMEQFHQQSGLLMAICIVTGSSHRLVF